MNKDVKLALEGLTKYADKVTISSVEYYVIPVMFFDVVSAQFTQLTNKKD